MADREDDRSRSSSGDEEQERSEGFALTTAALSLKPALGLVVVAALLFGAWSYFTMPAREDPGILIREAVVQTAHPGLSALEIEQLITKPIEEALLQVGELEEITSTSRDGVSIVHAIVQDRYTELDIIFEEVAEVVSEVTPQLPDGTRPPRVIDDFGDVGVVTVAIHGEDFTLDELTEFAEHVRTQLLAVPGTKKIDVLGGLERRVFVEIDDAQASQLGVPISAVQGAIASRNGVLAGGTADLGETGVLVNPSAEGNVVTRVANTLVPLPADAGGVRSPRGDGPTSSIRVGDFARVTEGYEDPPRQKAYYVGEEAVILSIAMQEQESVINYSRRLNEKIDEVARDLPVGLDLTRITVQADQVEKAVYGVTFNIGQTLVIVLIVVVIFLGLRTGLIVGSIVPAVVLATIALMGAFGLQLERMSLATIVISLGLLVDNGIVIAEDFKRRLEEVSDRDEALRQTSRELAFPLLSSSLTTIAVFLPLLLMQTESSEYTRSITYVVMISLAVSWVFAMTVTTALCHRLIEDPSEETDGGGSGDGPGFVQRAFEKVEGFYEKVLRFALAHRVLYVAAMGVFLAVGGWLMSTLPQQFFPNSDRAQVLVYADLPVGVTTRATDRAVQRMMDIVGDADAFPDVQDYAAYVGFGGPRFVLSLTPVDPAPNTSFMVLNVKDREAAQAVIPELRDALRAELPGVNARVALMFLGPEDPNVIEVQVKGPDAGYVYEKSRDLEDLLLSVDDTIEVWTNWYGRVERLGLDVDEQRAAAAGVTASDVADAVQRRLDGQVAGRIRDADDLIPIVLRGTDDERDDVEGLASLPVFPAQDGQAVPLGQVASVTREPGLGVIAREDMVRTATVQARNLRLSPQDLAPEIQEKLDAFGASLAPGHTVEIDGILNETRETNAAIAATGPLVLFLVVLLMVVQFGGFRRPAVILLSLPFAVTGAAIGLVVMQAQFGFMVILGIYALLGIIINNSIVLVDRIDIERAAREDEETDEDRASGTDDRPGKADGGDGDAVVKACVRRLRPILITTITTIAGFLPLIVGQDVLFYGMASALAFGLLIGTLLVSLTLTPVLYALFFRVRPEDEEEAAELERGGQEAADGGHWYARAAE